LLLVVHFLKLLISLKPPLVDAKFRFSKSE
jgi:hypothetical protein